MPEVTDWTGWRRTPEVAERLAREGMVLPGGRGRPPKGTEQGPSETRSIRLSAAWWAWIEQIAAGRGLTVHAALREAVTAWAAFEAPAPRAPRAAPHKAAKTAARRRRHHAA
jgi:hypothetical protein